jgi:uncharacterized protein
MKNQLELKLNIDFFNTRIIIKLLFFNNNFMAKQIYVNLPVKDLNKTNEFFKNLGFEFEANFSNENATCMIIAENIYVMLLVEEFFKTFIKKEISDASKTTEVLVCIDAESREKVDELVNKAIAN